MQATPVLFAVSLQVQQFCLKQNALNRLRNERIICFTLPANQEIAAGDEIEINDRIIDVQRVENCENQTLVYGWVDGEESSLQDELNVLANKQEQQEDDGELIGKVLQTFMMPDLVQAPVFLHETLLFTKVFPFLNMNLSTVYLPVATPPPLVA